jgi:hypothetical protein
MDELSSEVSCKWYGDTAKNELETGKENANAMRKTLSLLSLAVVSVALYAQTAASPQVPDPSMTPGTTQTGTQPQASTDTPTLRQSQGAAQIQATSVAAELTKGIDTKHARVGDELNAKTTTEAKLPDGTVIPKGTKLMGNVVEVAAKSKEQKNSHLVISLNRAVMKDGHDMPIHAAVTSVTAPASTQMADTPMSSGGSSASSGSGSSAGGSSATPSAPSMPSSSMAPPPQSVAGAMLKNTNDRVPVGNLPNVVLSAPNTPQSAGVLDGVGGNISLQSGTKFTVNVAAAQGGQ